MRLPKDKRLEVRIRREDGEWDMLGFLKINQSFLRDTYYRYYEPADLSAHAINYVDLALNIKHVTLSEKVFRDDHVTVVMMDHGIPEYAQDAKVAGSPGDIRFSWPYLGADLNAARIIFDDDNFDPVGIGEKHTPDDNTYAESLKSIYWRGGVGVAPATLAMKRFTEANDALKKASASFKMDVEDLKKAFEDLNASEHSGGVITAEEMRRIMELRIPTEEPKRKIEVLKHRKVGPGDLRGVHINKLWMDELAEIPAAPTPEQNLATALKPDDVLPERYTSNATVERQKKWTGSRWIYDDVPEKKNSWLNWLTGVK